MSIQPTPISYLEICIHLFSSSCFPFELIYQVDSFTVAHLVDMFPCFCPWTGFPRKTTVTEVQLLRQCMNEDLWRPELNFTRRPKEERILQLHFGVFPHWNYHSLRWSVTWESSTSTDLNVHYCFTDFINKNGNADDDFYYFDSSKTLSWKDIEDASCFLEERVSLFMARMQEQFCDYYENEEPTFLIKSVGPIGCFFRKIPEETLLLRKRKNVVFW